MELTTHLHLAPNEWSYTTALNMAWTGKPLPLPAPLFAFLPQRVPKISEIWPTSHRPCTGTYKCHDMPVTQIGLSNLTNTWRFVRQLCKRIFWRIVQVITQVQAERTLIAQGHSCLGGDAVQFCKEYRSSGGPTPCIFRNTCLSDILMPSSLTTRRHVQEESNIFTTMSSSGHAVGCRLLTVNVRS